MYLPDDLSPKPFNRSFWNSYVIQKKKTVRKLWDMIKVSTSIPKILRKLYGFPKKFRASLGKKMEILGNLPSEQIFYRNIPFGAPDALYKCIILITFMTFAR